MHLLATRQATLDETEAAVDLGHAPADIVLLSFSDSDLAAAAAAWEARREALPTLRLASLRKLRHPLSVDLYVESVIRATRVVIVRCLGGLDYWRYGIERLSAVAAETGLSLAVLSGDGRPDARLAGLSTVDAETVARLDVYFREGGAGNVGNALKLVANLIGGRNEIAPPQPMPEVIGMDRRGAAVPVANLAAIAGPRPTALILFYRASLLAADVAPIAALMEALEAQGLAAMAVAVTSLKDPAVATALDALMAQRPPAVILNTTAFSARRDGGTTVLDQADVPVLQVVLAGSSREAWEASPRGLGAADLAMNVVLPEIDGRILSRAVSFKNETSAAPGLEHTSTQHVPDRDRVDYVARLAAAWGRLRTEPARERRIALMLSDYPARAGRTGYAVGLDTAASAAEILGLLAAEGYETGGGEWTAADFAPLLDNSSSAIPPCRPPPQGGRSVGGDEINVAREDYRTWFARMPEPARAAITDAWGEPEDDPAFADGCFRFPGLVAGNVLVLLQPDRGALSDRERGYHDTSVPPRHGYVALYAWLREAQRIDALIHLGTHGTLEWLPGKALALAADCFPEAVLGPVPVVYPFIVNNPGEAVQAKRRIGAVTIGHLTPPLTAAGLNGPMAELEGLIEEYAEADGIDRRRAGLLEAEIIERAWASGLAQDCGVAKSDTARGAITKLDAQLCDIKELAIRDRLHVFGRAPDAEATRDLAAAMRVAGVRDEPPGALVQSIQECAAAERRGLLAALAGRRVPPGPSGAPTRGRADVLPTGRNLTTIDPRAIPTRTAAAVGARAAAEVVRRYLQDHGEHPRNLVLDLWASASLRTGGDDLAQALAYLGVRPTWDTGSNRVTGVEVLPLAKLDRPRIDATLRVSGLFRDVFAAQIALFELAVDLVAGLDEEDAWNPLAAARRRGESTARIFGGAPGSYGAAAAELILDGAWGDRSEIGEAYLAAASHAYGAREMAAPAGESFRARIAAADALVHAQDDRERDLLDGDGVADFAGGFAAAATALGRTPALYHLDTSRTEAPRVRSLAEEIARIVRGRLTNPRWIAGMLGHGHRGVAEVAQGVDALFAFAASTAAVPGHLFDAVHEAVVRDRAVAEKLVAANPAAADAIARRLEEAVARGLWAPRRNAVAGELAALRRARPEAPVVEAAQ